MTQQEIQLIDDKLSTEVIHRSEGDLLSQAMISKYAADMLIENEKEYQRYVEHLSKTSDITEGLRNLIDSVQVRLLTTCLSIEEELNKSNKAFADDITDLKKGLDKYLRILSDATLDSDRITWDNGEIQLGAWTFLSQARQWDLEILKKIESNYKKIDEELKEKLEEELNNFDTTEEVISKVIEELSSVPVIKELDELLNSGIKDIEILKGDLHTEVLERSKAIAEEALRMADALADEARLRAEGLAKEAQDRVDEIVREKNTRIEQIEAEVANRLESVAAINERVDDVNTKADDISASLEAQRVELAYSIEAISTKTDSIKAESDQKISDLNTKADGIHDEVSAETAARIADVSALNDGLTSEIQHRKDGDQVITTALENYKSSNDTALANVRTELTATVTATTANATKIDALDVRLTTNEDETGEAKALAASATQKADTALTETSALASQMTTVNASIEGIENALATKTDASAFNQLKAEVVEIDGKVLTNAQDLTALKTTVTGLDGKVTGNTSAISELTSQQVIQGDQITQLNSDTTALKTSLEGLEDGLATKVDSSAFNELITKVDKNADDITVQAGSITKLQSDLVLTNQAVNTKANTTALTALDTKVTNINGKVTSNTSAIIDLAGRVDVTENDISKKADASALSSLDTKVTAIDGKVTTQGTSITKLQNDLATTDQNVATKADATALNALSNTVTEQGGKIASNSTAITNLTNKVTTVEKGVAKKADATAVSSLSTKVSTLEGTVASQGTAVTKLQNDLALTNTAVSKKAESSALNALDSKVTQQGKTITSQGGAITQLQNDVSSMDTELGTKASSAALSALDTKVTQQGSELTSQGTAITKLENDLSTLSTDLDTKADSAALNALDSKVTTIDGTVTSQGTSITSLTNRVTKNEGNISKKADASAVTALDTKVTQQGKDITSQGSAITKLTNDLATTNSKVATKADAEAVSALTTRISNAEGVNTSQGTSITKLTNDLATTNTNVTKKANTTALNALDNKVTSVDGKVTANTNSITSLSGRVTATENGLATKADASALNNYYTKTEADTATAGKIDEFKSSLTAGGTNLIPASTEFRVGSAASAELERTILSDGSLRLTNKGALDTSYLASFQSADTNFNEVHNIATGSDITVTFWFKAVDISKLPTSYITSYLNGGSGGYIKLNGDLSALASGREVPFSNTRKWRGGTVKPYITATASSLGGGLILTKWQIEKGNIPSDWSDHSSAVQSQIDANASAIQATNSEVARVDGRVTTESNRITSLNGKISTVEDAISTKADASALSNMYTKAETDTKAQQIAAGELNKFTASLSAEGVNLYGYDMSTLAASSGTWAGSGYSISRVLGGGLTPQETAYKIKAGGVSSDYIFSGRGDWKSAIEPVIGNKYILSMYVKSPITKTVRLRPVGITEANGASALMPAENFDLVPDTWTRISVVYTTPNTNYPYIGWWLYHNYDGGAASDDNYVLVTRPMLERTYNEKAIPSVWTEGSGSSSAINANSAAIQNTDAEVKRVDGKINATNSAITTLEGRIAVNEKNIVLKADASALDALTTRVTTEEGKTASQGTRVTALENKVNHSTNGLASKASSKALTTLDSKVTLIDGRVTSNTSAITALNSSVTNVENKLSTKLDADVIASYYTKAETDSVAAGKVDEFKASIKGGGVNLFGYAMSTTQPSRGTWLGYAYNVTRVEGGGISESEHAYKVFPSSTINTSAYFVSGTGDWHTKVEKDTDYILSIYVKSPMAKTVRLRQLMLNDADARSWTANEESYSIPADTWSRISLRITEKKENYPYLSYALYFNTEGLSATEDNYILITRPMLETTIGSGKEPSAWVEGSGAGAFIDANATAIQNTNTEVARVDGVVKGHTTQLSKLTASIAGKADTSALNALTVRVEAEEGKSTSQANAITSLNSDMSSVLKDITISDVRSTNELPNFYWTSYSKRRVNEFKYNTAIGVSSFFRGSYCNLETIVPWTDSSGGNIIQTASSGDDPSLYVQRQSSGNKADATWTAWKQPIKDLRDTLGTKASASAVTSLTTKVNTIDGKVSSHASTLTQLQSKVDGNTAKLVIQGEVVDGLKASYVIKTDVNGLVSGFGLYNDGSSSTFGVNADSFYVGKGTQKKKAFLVTTANQVVNGVKYPAGVWIDTAFIAKASIGSAHIGDLVVDTIKIRDGAITTSSSFEVEEIDYTHPVNTGIIVSMYSGQLDLEFAGDFKIDIQFTTTPELRDERNEYTRIEFEIRNVDTRVVVAELDISPVRRVMSLEDAEEASLTGLEYEFRVGDIHSLLCKIPKGKYNVTLIFDKRSSFGGGHTHTGYTPGTIVTMQQFKK